MKKYRSHKIVEAAKITDMLPNEQMLQVEGDAVTPTEGWWERYKVSDRNYVGGYYVRYADGYDSWSPASAFEEGYTEVNA